jgi:hydrogenase nickel incorporation protein HypA/HybF
VHELSIAQAVVDIAAAHAARMDGPDGAPARVVAVHVRVGHLRQVVPEALRLGFELCAVGTPAEDAELELEHVPAVVRCRACAGRRELESFPLACPACGSADVQVVSGEELVVDALELEHEHEELTRSG